MSRDELDDLLRSHLGHELDGQRGRALRTFEERVTRPMQMRLSRPTRAARQRQWTTTAFAMAACLAVGFVLPRFLTAPGDDGWPSPGWSGTAINPSFAEYDAPRRGAPISPFTVDGPSPDQLPWRNPIHAAPRSPQQTQPPFEIVEPSERARGWPSR